MSEKLHTPRRKSAGNSGKITLYFEEDVSDLYREGKENGWDVCKIMKDAGSKAIRDRAEILRQKAADVPEDEVG